MAKVETMDVLVAMAKAILEIAGETSEATPAKAEKPAKAENVKTEKKAVPADVEDIEDDDLEGKTTKELYQMCVDAGIKVPKYGKNKAFYIAALHGDSAEDTDGEADNEAEDDPYAGKTAKELFELCKKRGIKAAPKKKADVYIELLKKADAAEAEADDDDWEDDEVEEEAPKKQTKQKAKAKAKKSAEPEEDEDDDDWDI